MNIVLINHYAGSVDMGMEFRPYYMAKEWIRHGHRVDIIAADYSHLRQKNPKVARDWQEEVIDGIHYHWIRTISYEGNGVKRAVTMFQFVGKIWLRAKWIAKRWKPDVIITSSTYPLDTYAGQRIKKYRIAEQERAGKVRKTVRGGVILIHEVHDMWPLSPVILGGMSKKHPFIQMMQAAENSFCRNSDRVVSLLPYAKKYFAAHGMGPEKFYTIANGVVVEDWDNPEPLPKPLRIKLSKWKEEEKFILCFFGSHTSSYNLDNLIRAVKQLPDERIQVLFVGEGTYKKHLQKMAAEDSKTKSRFWFHPYIPKRSIPSLIQQVDGVYIGIQPCILQKYGICMNKLFDAMMGGKPILFSAAFPNNYVNQYQCGITVAPEDTAGLTEAIKRLRDMSEEERECMGENGRRAVKEEFTYDRLAEQFEKVFNGFLSV